MNRRERLLSGLVSALGLATAVALAVTTALYEAGWCSLYVFSVRCPLSLVLAVVVNPALVWFATSTVGRRSAGIAPAIAWCVVWLAGTVRTAEGDLIVLADNWVGIATTLLGPVAFAVAIYGSMLVRDGIRSPAGHR